MIEKKLLSEIAFYYGKVEMPENFEIDKGELVKDITLSNLYEDVSFPFSKNFDKLKTYITDFMYLKYKLNLIYKKTYGKYYETNEISPPKLEVDPVDLRNSSDFILLYGVEIDPKTCEVVIYYDDNRRKGRSWTKPLENNKFILFPTSQLYYINNKKNSHLNFIQTILFDYI
jgi:hypothetical protein